MLLAAMLMLGGLFASVIVLCKTMYATQTDAPLEIIAVVWLGAFAAHMPMLAYAISTLASALWVEALARILAELKRRNALSMER